MGTKEKIIEKPNQVKDETVLTDFLSMIDLELSMCEEPVVLTSAQKDFLDEGLEELEKGNIHSDAEAKKVIKQWLKEK
jgi:hypothetical protein